ncbi:DeoR family transcriptional regulator [Streptomyces sp. NPDC001941]|uniref:DeoR family transcriptional regulator n=1 Tax=Streptomyces sp. NPDC001941 TaxID=3154659 RepID=UPI003320A874
MPHSTHQIRLATGKPTAQARRTHIAREAMKKGHVSLRALAAELDVSVMTVHRDLQYLADHDQVRRVRGGAVAPWVAARLHCTAAGEARRD